MKPLLMLFFSTLLCFPSRAQSPEEITRTLRFDASDAPRTLVLKNIEGHVRIIGDQGDDVRLTAQKTIRAHRREDRARAEAEVQLVTEVYGRVAWVYLEAPYIQVERHGDDLHYDMHRRDDDYQVRYDFTVRVPARIDLRVSTVNEGDVSVEHVQGHTLTLNNVNGDIRGSDISGTTHARTVNGEIAMAYAAPPTEASTYRTINGDIRLHFPEDLSADVRFKSMHGDLFTDFPDLAYLPAQVSTDRSRSGAQTTYRIDKSTQVRIGEGGPRLDLEVLNGSVYLRHQ